MDNYRNDYLKGICSLIFQLAFIVSCFDKL